MDLMQQTLVPDPAARAALLEVPSVDLASNLRTARAGGHGYSTVLGELIKLQFGPGKLSVHEYFYYRLWDSMLSIDEKRQFIGRDQERHLHFACNDEVFRDAVDDKLRFHAAMLTAGLRVPQLLGIVHGSRQIAGIPTIADTEELRVFLANRSLYPIFGKPIDGVFSLGAFRADDYDVESGCLVMHDGTRLDIEDCAAEIVGYSPGYLFQQVLLSKTDIAARFGARLWSTRLLIFLTPDGPQLASAVCKIPIGSNIADNFWRGNMLGAVEIKSGTIARTVRGTGAEMKVDQLHPDTGEAITGTIVPDWNAVLALGLEAAATLPAIRTQSWDIALTDSGPVILEANYGGDLNLSQLAWGRGALNAQYHSHLAHCGYKA
jgi:hypothetical protein